MDCTNCGETVVTTNEAQRYRLKKTGRIFCTPTCGYKHRDKARVPKQTQSEIRNCANCGKPFQATGWKLRYKTPSCSNVCAEQRRAAISSVTMTNTNRVYASNRMKKNNPMQRKDVRNKVAATLKTRNHKPNIRGGNGHGLTECEQLLLVPLSPLGFVGNWVVPTGKQPGCPYHYKLDLAHPALKIAVEVDGPSHNALSRKQQDSKKEAFLRGKGWAVFRFTNQQVRTEISSITLKLIRCTHTLRTGS